MSYQAINGKIQPSDHSLSTYAKFSKKLAIPYPVTRKRTCAYQGLRIASFRENFADALCE